MLLPTPLLPSFLNRSCTVSELLTQRRLSCCNPLAIGRFWWQGSWMLVSLQAVHFERVLLGLGLLPALFACWHGSGGKELLPTMAAAICVQA